MLWSPWKVALLGLGLWLLLRLVAPIEVAYPLSFYPLLYITACYAAFFVGCFASDSLSANHAEVKYGWKGDLNLTLFWISMSFGLVGIVTKYYDRTVLRGVDYFAGAIEVRDALSSSTTTPLGAIGGALLPFCYLPLMLILASNPSKRHTRLVIFSAVVFIIPAVESLAQLSRILILVGSVMALAMVSLLRFDGKIFIPKIMIPASVAAILVVIASTALFSMRLEQYDYSLQDSINDSAYAQTIRATSEAKSEIYSGDPAEKAFYTAVTPSSLYYLSGIYEFGRLMDRPDEQYFAWGTYLLYPYTRVISAVAGYEEVRGLNEELLFSRVGVFTSFFGPWWVDFGWIGVPLFGLVGFGLTRLAAIARRGYINVLPLYLYSIVILIYLPVVNLLISGNGFFAVHGLGLFALFTSFQKDPRMAVASAV